MVTVREKDLVLFLHPRIEAKALYMLSKYCPTELHSQATSVLILANMDEF